MRYLLPLASLVF